MNELIVWAFLAVVQMQGFAGGAAQTQVECEEQRQEALKIYDVVVISDCAPVKLTKPVGQ